MLKDSSMLDDDNEDQNEDIPIDGET